MNLNLVEKINDNGSTIWLHYIYTIAKQLFVEETNLKLYTFFKFYNYSS